MFEFYFPSGCVSQRHDKEGRHVRTEHRNILAFASACWVVFSVATCCTAQCHSTENDQASRSECQNVTMCSPHDNLLHYDITTCALPEKLNFDFPHSYIAAWERGCRAKSCLMQLEAMKPACGA